MGVKQGNHVVRFKFGRQICWQSERRAQGEGKKIKIPGRQSTEAPGGANLSMDPSETSPWNPQK